MRKLRRLFLRAGLDAREVRLLRGILADAQRMARLARGAERAHRARTQRADTAVRRQPVCIGSARFRTRLAAGMAIAWLRCRRLIAA